MTPQVTDMSAQQEVPLSERSVSVGEELRFSGKTMAGTSGGAQMVAGDFNGDGKSDASLLGASGWGTVPVAMAWYQVTPSPTATPVSLTNNDGTYVVSNTGVTNMPAWAASSTVK